VKSNKILLGVSLFSAMSFAMDIDYFGGVGIGRYDIIVKSFLYKNDNLEAQIKSEDKDKLEEIRIGAILNKTHKLYVSFDKMKSDSDVDLNMYAFNYNYLFNLEKLQLKPYIGTSYAIIKYEEKLYNDSDITWEKSKAKLNANSLLLNVGFDLVIKKHHCINFEYSFSLTASGDETVGLTYNGNSYEEKIELDKMSKWIISYNYLF